MEDDKEFEAEFDAVRFMRMHGGGAALAPKLDNAYLRQLHYAELEMRAFANAIDKFAHAHPDRVSVLGDSAVFEKGAYEEFQEFCKTL